MTPQQASLDAIKRIASKYPKFSGAIVAVDRYGNHGAACHGFTQFGYSFKDGASDNVKVNNIKCS